MGKMNKGVTEETVSTTMWLVVGVIALILIILAGLVLYYKIPLKVIFE